MEFGEKNANIAGDAGIFTIDHPVIKYPVQIADGAELPAGTILKKSASGGNESGTNGGNAGGEK